MRTFVCLLFSFSIASVWSQSGPPTNGHVLQEPSATDERPAAEQVRQQIVKLEHAWVAAEIKHDATTLERILDPQFVATFGAEKPYDKQTFMKEIVSGELDPTESQTLSDEAVFIDHDTAIVVGIDTISGTKNGTPYTMAARYTVTYILRNGQWLALAEHLARIPTTR